MTFHPRRLSFRVSFDYATGEVTASCDSFGGY